MCARVKMLDLKNATFLGIIGNMSKKKETEIQISDSKDGVVLTVGKKMVAEIKNVLPMIVLM
jgi:hypothetical protein